MGDNNENEEMGSAKKWFKWSQLVLAMLLVQVFAAGMQLLSRVILVEGTFVFALLAYRHIIGALCVAPLAFYFERSQEKKFGWSVWFWLFVNALTGITFAMGLFYFGLRDTTAAYSVNFLNLIPIVTFVFSIVTRMEQLKWHTRAGKVKVLGALLCVVGALISSLYKGNAFHIGHQHVGAHVAADLANAHWTRGTFFLLGSCLSYGAWFIVQAKLHKVLPLKYWATMLTCVIGAVQSVMVGLCLDRSRKSWKLEWNLQLVTILYSGFFSTAATFCLLLWTISKQGPTYPSMFNPLSLIFVTLCEALLLGEALRVGTVVGMVMIIFGLYSFLWGKAKESKRGAGQITRPDKPGSANIELAGPQQTATVVPRSSPDRHNTDNNYFDVENQVVRRTTEQS